MSVWIFILGCGIELEVYSYVFSFFECVHIIYKFSTVVFKIYWFNITVVVKLGLTLNYFFFLLTPLSILSFMCVVVSSFTFSLSRLLVHVVVYFYRCFVVTWRNFIDEIEKTWQIIQFRSTPAYLCKVSLFICKTWYSSL